MAESWIEQTQALADTWIQAQARIWNDWAEAVGRVGMTPLPGVGAGPAQWQTAALRMLAPWTGDDAEEVARQVVERMFAGEEAFLGFVGMTVGMLQTVAPKIDVGDEWMELLRRYIDQMKEDSIKGRGAWMRPESYALAAGDVTELWRLYVAELERLYGPWTGALQHASVEMGDALRGDPQAARSIFGGFTDAYESTFGRVLAAPAVGYTRETAERLMKGFDSWVEMNRAAVDFQTEMANTGLHVMETLMRRLVDMSEKGEQINSLRGLYELWLDTAETAYFELFGTESFADLQGRFVNATMQFRRRQTELVDEFLDAVGVPGRKEVDQVHRRVYDLRIELRYMKRDMAKLRRELDALQAERDAAAAAAAGAEVAVEHDDSTREPAAAAERPGRARATAKARSRTKAKARPRTKKPDARGD